MWYIWPDLTVGEEAYPFMSDDYITVDQNLSGEEAEEQLLQHFNPEEVESLMEEMGYEPRT